MEAKFGVGVNEENGSLVIVGASHSKAEEQIFRKDLLTEALQSEDFGFYSTGEGVLNGARLAFGLGERFGKEEPWPSLYEAVETVWKEAVASPEAQEAVRQTIAYGPLQLRHTIQRWCGAYCGVEEEENSPNPPAFPLDETLQILFEDGDIARLPSMGWTLKGDEEFCSVFPTLNALNAPIAFLPCITHTLGNGEFTSITEARKGFANGFAWDVNPPRKPEQKFTSLRTWIKFVEDLTNGSVLSLHLFKGYIQGEHANVALYMTKVALVADYTSIYSLPYVITEFGQEMGVDRIALSKALLDSRIWSWQSWPNSQDGACEALQHRLPYVRSIAWLPAPA